MKDSNITSLERIFSSPIIEPFIRKLVFTNFKNIAPKQELTFDYPITVLVGPNGTNKTSALVALYGAVPNKTLAKYWFTTPLDRANPNENKSEPYQSYFYTYKDGKNTAEVLQVNNQRANRNVDYWESDRPKKHFGMNTDIDSIVSSNKVQTRWNKINKNVLYINFRSELSAFDRCLYHANMPSKKFKTPQDYIRAKSNNLKKSIEQNYASFKLNKKEKIISNRVLSNNEVEIISKILNKKYTAIQFIEHSFFDVKGGTAFIKTSELNYSEAFAGSGEFAVISLISKIISAPEKSLILLDEPEVSLHPYAQKELINFLNEQVKQKKHQIVISTHSAEIVDALPNQAIKLFSEDQITQKVEINNHVDKQSVFHTIGKDYNKIPLYVEDKLAKAVLDIAIKEQDYLKNNFQVEYYPGGSESIISRFNTLIETNHVQLVFLDGDKESDLYKENNSFPKNDNIANEDLIKVIHELFFKINFAKDSNSDSYEQERKFINNAKNNITYLPFDSPEYFILKENNLCNEFLSNLEAKAELKRLALENLSNDYLNSDSIFYHQISLLNKIDKNCEEFKKIRYILNFYLKHKTVDGWSKSYK